MEMQLPDGFREFLKLLNSHKVEYLRIGGFAVGYYGYPFSETRVFRVPPRAFCPQLPQGISAYVGLNFRCITMGLFPRIVLDVALERSVLRFAYAVFLCRFPKQPAR
jgi:hypothetical protein